MAYHEKYYRKRINILEDLDKRLSTVGVSELIEINDYLTYLGMNNIGYNMNTL
jgi:hypothetical protein